MVQSCSADKCTARKDKYGQHLKFHKFPKNPEIREQWIIAINRKNYQPSPTAAICSQHFKETDYEINVHGNKVLKKNSIPSVFNIRNSRPKKNRKKETKNVSDKDKENMCNSSDVVDESSQTTECLLIEPTTLLQTTSSITELIQSGQRCRTCLNTNNNNRFVKVTDQCSVDKTVKEAILLIMPILKIEIKDDDHVCYNCFQNIQNLLNFVVNCLKVDDLLWIESENIHDDSFFPPQVENVVDWTDKPENIENDVSKELEFWGQCCEDFDSRRKSYNKIRKKTDELEDDDINSDNYETVISSGPLESDLPQFLNSLGKKVRVVKFRGTTDKGNHRVLLLGSKAYRHCPVCEEEFESESVLNEHFDENHPDVSKAYLIKTFEKVHISNSLQCDMCGTNFKSLNSKLGHTATCVKLKCPYCNNLILECNFNSHLKKEHPEHVKFKCFKCNQEFHYYRIFKEHRCDVEFCIEKPIVKKKDRTNKKRKCTFCLEVIPLELYTDHINSNHKNFKCSECTKTFFNKLQLDQHKLQHVKELCPFCGKLLARCYLDKHIQSFHGDHLEEQVFNCAKCNKRFHTKRLLTSHVYRVHKRSNSVCELCGLTVRSICLKNHYLTQHSNTKDYLCKFCNKRFSRKDYLAKHVVTHGVENHYSKIAKQKREGSRKRAVYNYIRNPNEQLSCKFCLKTFNQVSALKYHINNHIKLVRFKCQYCGMTYSNEANLKRHEKLHKNSEYKFRCNTCWKKFSNQEDLIHHESLKHNKKRQCEYCDESFSRKFAYMSHLVEVHYDQEEILKKKESMFLESLNQNTSKEPTED